MKFDLSKKVLTRDSGKVVYGANGDKEHDNLSLITESLWSANCNDVKLTVKFGVLADRLERWADRTAVELSDTDVQVIKKAMEILGYPTVFTFPIIAIIDPNSLKE